MGDCVGIGNGSNSFFSNWTVNSLAQSPKKIEEQKQVGVEKGASYERIFSTAIRNIYLYNSKERLEMRMKATGQEVIYWKVEDREEIAKIEKLDWQERKSDLRTQYYVMWPTNDKRKSYIRILNKENGKVWRSKITTVGGAEWIYYKRNIDSRQNSM